MREVAIVGIGQTPVGEHWDSGLRELAVQAILGALDDAGLKTAQSLYVGNMLSGILVGQEHLGALIADYAGLQGIEAVKVEAACGSGAAAFRQAMLAVASGAVDSAIAVGIEKLTESSAHFTTEGLATAADADYETAMGLSFVALNALLMRRYMYEYGYQKEDFAVFIQNAHQNAMHNPNAMFHYPVSGEQYAASKMIADPINLLDSSPIADGAAAVVLLPLEKALKISGSPIRIAACEIGTDRIAIDNRENPLWLKGVQRSVSAALRTSGVSCNQIDFFEVHDAFSIMTALSLEASGFAEPGQAVRLANEGHFNREGQLPLSTFGGLKARGHPVGATGLYQIVESVLQLRAHAPEPIQIPRARFGMAQNVGGSGATVVTTILTAHK